MYDSLIYVSKGKYIEADSRLSAMQTFLDDLQGNPAARPLLLTLAGEFDQFLTEALAEEPVDAAQEQRLRRSFNALQESIADLPTTATVANESAWQQARMGLQQMQDQFARFLKYLKTYGRMQQLAVMA